MSKAILAALLAATSLVGLGADAADDTPAAEAPPKVFEEPAPVAPPPNPADLKPITYSDGVTSTNDRCPIRKGKLNTKIEPVWVNQHPVGFC